MENSDNCFYKCRHRNEHQHKLYNTYCLGIYRMKNVTALSKFYADGAVLPRTYVVGMNCYIAGGAENNKAEYEKYHK